MITFLKVLTAAALLSCSAFILKAEDPAPAPAAPAKPYTLDTCVVSGEKLGEMGESYTFTYQGQEIKLCCESCKPKFDKDPATYLKKLEVK